MSDEPDRPVLCYRHERRRVMADANLELLQAMVQRVLDGHRRIEVKLDRIGDDLADLKLRTTNTEEALAGVNRRLDRLDMRVERIERRLDLTDAPA